ncbi:hypothetical protein SAMN04488040_2993 [Sulfitobacter marinus]|uniref:Uncharacterized protein n=1 Tax=Sulfitobacter marinus TaxID=394264 RepID=A0A1I6V0F4_9RHOB|nr:hypothetical protein [Sulfitobacter marinus]SFT07180.1 hypothetical protein SAMN04488040_2993 [Sulfitobacter marinus]
MTLIVLFVLGFARLGLRYACPDQKVRRWTAVIGAIGVTTPCFGLS